MKKALFGATVLAALLGTTAMAATKTEFTLTPPGIRTTPVDIVVTNYTDKEIFLTVPGKLMKEVYPGQAMHVLKYAREFTDLDLYDNNDNNFFMGYNLCPYATIDVYYPTPSGTQVSNNYC